MYPNVKLDKIIKIPNQNIIIGQNEVFVIAEIGKNFIQTLEDKSVEEYLENAKELIKLAHQTGVNAIKFQTHVLEDEQLNIDVTSPHFKGSDRYSWVERNEKATPLWFWQELKRYADSLGILFFSTPMSRNAAKKLNKVGVDIWKVGSGDMLDFVLLDYLASTKKPIIISSGMSSLKEIDKAYAFLKKRNAQFSIMHCISQYPCPPQNLKLETINFLKKRYNVPVGFSDHSIEATPSLIAVSMGAKIIEKHFSLSRDLWGSDHKTSLKPDELKYLVSGIRFLEKNKKNKDTIVNNFKYFLTESNNRVVDLEEEKFRPYFRKSIMCSRDIQVGETITSEMLYAMRPQTFAGGISSEEYENILGKKTNKLLKKYDPITWNVLSI